MWTASTLNLTLLRNLFRLKEINRLENNSHHQNGSVSLETKPRTIDVSSQEESINQLNFQDQLTSQFLSHQLVLEPRCRRNLEVLCLSNTQRLPVTILHVCVANYVFVLNCLQLLLVLR